MDRSKLWYSVSVAALGVACFVLGAIAVGVPQWGTYRSSSASAIENGYFGPWTVCLQSSASYTRSVVCRPLSEQRGSFRPDRTTYIAGIFAAVGVAILGVYCIFCLLQIAMMLNREQICCKYSYVMMCKLLLSIGATLFAITAAGIFAIQTDGYTYGYRVERGVSFFLQIALIFANFFLTLMTVYDYLYSRRVFGNPTVYNRDPEGDNATTIGNPGFRDNANKRYVSNNNSSKNGAHSGSRNGIKGGSTVAMTDSSGKPYATSGHHHHHHHHRTSRNNGLSFSNGSTSTIQSNNGSVGSIASAASSIGSNRMPLRSSLKKPRPPPSSTDTDDGLGIANRGFNPASPTFGRNGSVKKVRIQTQTTEV